MVQYERKKINLFKNHLFISEKLKRPNLGHKLVNGNIVTGELCSQK